MKKNNCSNHFKHNKCKQIRHSGIIGIFGGIINLGTTALYGSSKIIKTIVEGSVWQGCYYGYNNCPHNCTHHRCI